MGVLGYSAGAVTSALPYYLRPKPLALLIGVWPTRIFYFGAYMDLI